MLFRCRNLLRRRNFNWFPSLLFVVAVIVVAFVAVCFHFPISLPSVLVAWHCVRCHRLLLWTLDMPGLCIQCNTKIFPSAVAGKLCERNLYVIFINIYFLVVVVFVVVAGCYWLCLSVAASIWRAFRVFMFEKGITMSCIGSGIYKCNGKRCDHRREEWKIHAVSR